LTFSHSVLVPRCVFNILFISQALVFTLLMLLLLLPPVTGAVMDQTTIAPMAQLAVVLTCLFHASSPAFSRLLVAGAAIIMHHGLPELCAGAKMIVVFTSVDILSSSVNICFSQRLPHLSSICICVFDLYNDRLVTSTFWLGP
jgi:hypothetical protein